MSVFRKGGGGGHLIPKTKEMFYLNLDILQKGEQEAEIGTTGFLQFTGVRIPFVFPSITFV